MFGILKLLPLCLLRSFTWSNFYAPSLFAFSNTFFLFPLLEETPGQSSTCDWEVFRRCSKVIFFASLGHDVQRALFHIAHRKSQWQMWKSFHRLTLHLHSTLNGAALHHSLFPCTVVTWPFKPSRKFGTRRLFALTFTVVLTTENASVCVRAW